MSIISIEKKDKVGIITINRSEKYNVLNSEGYEGLANAMHTLSQDNEINVIKIQGSGKAFCAGSDINDCLHDNVHQFRKHYRKVAEALKSIGKSKVPVVAKVHGYALGGGCGITAACDLAIAAEGTVFGFPEVDLNIFPTTVMPPVLRATNEKRAFELLFLGEKFDAQKAESFGIINKVVPLVDLDNETDRIVNFLANVSPTAIQMGKEAFKITKEMNYYDSYDYLYNIMAMIANHDIAEQSFKNFLEKKKK